MSRGHATPQPEFGRLFGELLATRARYEGLRMSNAPLIERSYLIDRLHELRHEMGVIRRTI